MNKFDKIFVTGLAIIGTPTMLIFLMLILSLIGPPKKSEHVIVDKEIVYDTVKVKKVIYDTVRIFEKRQKKQEVKEEVKVEETKKDTI